MNTPTPTPSARHCGYCSEGQGGSCDGVSCNDCINLLADWRRMKEVLEIAEPYIVDPDEFIGLDCMTLEYRSPLSKEQKLQKEIESVRKTKADKKKVNDVLRSLSYSDSSKEELEKACLKGDDDACDKYVKLHPESIVKSQDIRYTDSPSQQ